jgi:hypothetical protein
MAERLLKVYEKTIESEDTARRTPFTARDEVMP